MALLTDEQRAQVWADLMRQQDLGRVGALTKPDLRAAVNAVDAWLGANAAALNGAIPQPARGQLTARQKSLLLTSIVRARYRAEA